MKQATLTGMISIVVLGCIAVVGSTFYLKVLPKLQEPPAPPRPKPPAVTLYPTTPTIKTSIPWVAALPHNTVVHLAHQTANAHQAWSLANMGKMTDPDSLFARQGITVRFFRQEDVEDRINALVLMAEALNRGNLETLLADDQTSLLRGVYFFTVGGDSSSWVISQANRALKRTNPAFEAEIIGFGGLSAGENQFMGPSEWQREPQKALGRVVVGVPYDSAWSVLVLWCAQNDLPLNADQAFYNPKALNFVQVDTPQQATQKYLEEATFERIFLSQGRDARGRRVRAGEKRRIGLHGVVTQTPFDRQIAAARNEWVTIASTKHYPNQTPQFIVGLKQWNAAHYDTVVNLLAALFEASLRIENSDRELKAERIQAKAEVDVRWQAAQYAYELFDAATPDNWYRYYHAAKALDERGSGAADTPDTPTLGIDVGGAAVADLQQNLRFFGLGQSGPDRGEVVYSRFARLAKQYEVDLLDHYPKWEAVFNDRYLKSVLERFPDLATSNSEQPSYIVEIKKELPPPPPPPPPPQSKPKPSTYYSIYFELSEASLTTASVALLQQAAERIVSIGKVRLEIHGYTDTTGSPEYNRELARLRSTAVYNWLKEVLGTLLYTRCRIDWSWRGEKLY